MKTDLSFLRKIIDLVWNRESSAINVVSKGSFIKSTLNSSDKLLGSGGVFNGLAEPVLGYSSILVNVDSDQDSLINAGLTIYFSEDGKNFQAGYFQDIGGDNFQPTLVPVTGKYFKLTYINGGIAQTRFNLSTYLLPDVQVNPAVQRGSNYYNGWVCNVGGKDSTAVSRTFKTDATGVQIVDLLGKAEDAAHVSGDAGLPIWSVRNDALAAGSLAGTDGDYQALQSTSNGDLRTAQLYPVVVSGTLTRPANTTTYTINDELTDTSGNILTISGCARYNGGGGYIDAITVINSVNAATDPTLDIYVFDTTSTPAADNAAFVPSDAAMNTVIIAKSLGTAQNGDTATTGNLIWQLSGFTIPFVCGAASTSLFVRFAVRNGYIPPANSETYTVRLHIRQM